MGWIAGVFVLACLVLAWAYIADLLWEPLVYPVIWTLEFLLSWSRRDGETRVL